jgi:hypothetical protein
MERAAGISTHNVSPKNMKATDLFLSFPVMGAMGMVVV